MISRATEIANLIRQVGIAHRTKANEWIADASLTPDQAFALGHIVDNQDNGVIARDLAEVTRTKPASVANLVKGLETRGLITRAPSPTDSRIKLIHPTELGTQLHADFKDTLGKADEDIFGSLTPAEQDQLIALLERITENS